MNEVSEMTYGPGPAPGPGPGYGSWPGAAYPDRAAMARHYAELYPRLVADYYPYVQGVCREMDQPELYPLLPRERFDSMVDTIMSRIEADRLLEWDDYRRRPRRRNLARSLIAALLISELLCRRRYYYC